MGNQAGIIIINVKNELFHFAKRLILNEVKGIECLRIFAACFTLKYKLEMEKIIVNKLNKDEVIRAILF